MAKPKLTERPVKVSLSTSNQVGRFLNKLTKTGLYGKTKSEVAEQLLREKIVDMMKEDLPKKLRQ